MNQQEFNELFRKRSKQVSKEIILITTSKNYSDALGIMRKQLIRSSTSVAANFRAVCRARSEREKFAKLCIVVEEADETLSWIEMLTECNLIPNVELASVEKESEEILKVMSAYKNKMRNDH